MEKRHLRAEEMTGDGTCVALEGAIPTWRRTRRRFYFERCLHKITIAPRKFLQKENLQFM